VPLRIIKEVKKLVKQVYLSIYGIYIAPLLGNYSEVLPAQARAKKKVLRLNEYIEIFNKRPLNRLTVRLPRIQNTRLLTRDAL